MGPRRASRTWERGWRTEKRSKKDGAGKNKRDGALKRGGDKVRGAGQTLDGRNRRAGKRDRCYLRDSEYHLSPECPWWDTP